MEDLLDETLKTIGDEYADKIARHSRNYVEVDIGEKAKNLGFLDLSRKYNKVLAIVPVEQAQPGMKVRIDGRTFSHYGQLKSGVVVPRCVVRESSLRFQRFIPNESMILNFC